MNHWCQHLVLFFYPDWNYFIWVHCHQSGFCHGKSQIIISFLALSYLFISLFNSPLRFKPKQERQQTPFHADNGWIKIVLKSLNPRWMSWLSLVGRLLKPVMLKETECCHLPRHSSLTWTHTDQSCKKVGKIVGLSCLPFSNSQTLQVSSGVLIYSLTSSLLISDLSWF